MNELAWYEFIDQLEIEGLSESEIERILENPSDRLIELASHNKGANMYEADYKDVEEEKRPVPPTGAAIEKKIYQVGEQTIREIVTNLSQEIKPHHLKQKKMGGKDITYLPWYMAVKYLDHFAPGWNYEVRSIQQIGANCAVVVRITIPTSDGHVWREATGIEDDDKSGFGDPTSNSESMALRRAAAKFGLGLYLYQK